MDCTLPGFSAHGISQARILEWVTISFSRIDHILGHKSSLGKFLEKYDFPKLDQEEIENLNRPITSMEIETVIRNLQQTKAQVQMASQLNSTKNLEKS